MLQIENMPEKTFENYQEASAFFNARTYSDTAIKAHDCVLEYDGFKVGSDKYDMTDTFIDALFGITKLPRANEKVLPTENVINDINTLLHAGTADNEYLLRTLDGKAYSLFTIKENKIKLPLNHKEYLDGVLQSIKPDDIHHISLSKKFLRLSTYDKGITYDVNVNDAHHFGIDFVNGETYRGFPLTAASMIYRLICSNGAVAPFENKMVKFKVAEDLIALKQKFIEIASNLVIDNDFTIERLQKMNEIALNEGLVELVASGTRFMPLTAREAIFSPFYEQDIEGNLSKNFKDGSCNGLTLYDIYNRVTSEAHMNPAVGPIHRYKAEVFAGTLINENNKHVQKLIKN